MSEIAPESVNGTSTLVTSPSLGVASPPLSDTPQDKPYVVFENAKAFEDRMNREARARMKSRFGASEEDIETRLKEYEALKVKQEEQRLSEMSEIDRYRAAAEAAQREAQQATETARLASAEVSLVKLCAEKGIKNMDYARYHLDNALRQMGDGGQLDERTFFDQIIQNPRERLALGIEDIPAPPQVISTPMPAHSTPARYAIPGTPGGPPSAPHATAQPPAKTAMDMSPSEWSNYKANLGI